MKTIDNVLILIPCCGSKVAGGRVDYDESKSIMGYLSTSSRDHLWNLRTSLSKHFSMSLGRDVSPAHRNNEEEYLEAYHRYSGPNSQIYGQIFSDSWDKLGNTSNLDLVVVSALYGLLRFNEPIRDYDVAMKDKIGTTMLKTWWRNNQLSSVLRDYVRNNSIAVVHNVLSNDYCDALRDCFDNFRAEYIYHDFSEYRSGSNAHRGMWVNRYIQDF